MSQRDPVLARAEFDSRLPTYFMLQAVFGLALTIFGIPLIPLWLLFGRGIHKRQYENLSCELTARSLNMRRGYVFRVQQNIPLDKITDLAVYEGPLLRALGLCSMRVETAGGGQAAATGQAFLPGVIGLDAFRERVLEQRDAIVLGESRGSALADDGVRPTTAGGNGEGQVLREIRDSLLRIEERLQRT